MIADGCKAAWEIGPSRVLSGLMRKIDRNVSMTALGGADDLLTAGR
jgi:malonyl CoA-acyl carrier protein transacylase